MTELDKIRAEIEMRKDEARDRRDNAQRDFDFARTELEAHDRAVAAMGVPAVDSPPTRHSIQRPVMALFGPERETWTEIGIITKTCLPAEAVRKFLGRAVRIGMLRRLESLVSPGLPHEYGLPVKPAQEAADG